MREITVKAEGREIKLSTSAYIVPLYAELFGRNIFQEMGEIVDLASKGTIPYEKTDIIYRVVYTMAKHSDPSLPGMNEWLRSIDGIYTILEMVPEIIQLWAEDSQTQSVPKKNQS